jgi:hypothetical protein
MSTNETPQVPSVRRVLYGPALEWLDRGQLAAWLNIGPEVLDEMIRKGDVFRGVRLGRRTVRWHWRDAVAISIAFGWRHDTGGAHSPP